MQDVYKTISNKLKEKFPEFSKDVNHYSPEGCAAFVKIVGDHLPIKEFYSVEQILDGYDIANDTLHHIAISDNNYNKQSGYGNFCGIGANRAKKTIPENLITEEKNEIAVALFEKLKSSEIKEDCNARCSDLVKIVGDHLPIKEYYSVNEIISGYSIASDVLHHIAKVDDTKDYFQSYSNICDATTNKPNNNNFELMVSHANLKQKFNAENIIEFQKQSEKVLELKLAKMIFSNKEDANSKIDTLTETVNTNKETLQKLIAINKEAADAKITTLVETVNANKEAILLDLQKMSIEENPRVEFQNEVHDGQAELNDNVDQTTDNIGDL